MRLPERFFFYGTLSAGMDNPVIAAVRPKLGPGRPARVAGRLHAIPERDGWYPALVAGDGLVEGQVYAVGPGFTADDLALLDRYEAFDPDDPEGSEYIRTVIVVETDGGPLAADAYLYRAALPASARPIAEPSFAAYLAAHGYRPLAPRD